MICSAKLHTFLVTQIPRAWSTPHHLLIQSGPCFVSAGEITTEYIFVGATQSRKLISDCSMFARSTAWEERKSRESTCTQVTYCCKLAVFSCEFVIKNDVMLLKVAFNWVNLQRSNVHSKLDDELLQCTCASLHLTTTAWHRAKDQGISISENGSASGGYRFIRIHQCL